MNSQKIEDIKKHCGFVLIQTTEQSILNDMAFHLETPSREVREIPNKNKNKIQSKKESKHFSIDETNLHDNNNNTKQNQQQQNKQQQNQQKDIDFDLQNDRKNISVYNSSQSCYIIKYQDELLIVTSGQVFFNFLEQQDIQQLESKLILDLQQIQFNAQFHLCLENYPNKEFITITPLKLTLDENILEFFQDMRNKSFISKYKNHDIHINNEYDQRILKNTSVLFFKIKNHKDKIDLQKYLNNYHMPYSNKMPQQGQNVNTISSPFGILSQQLYHNLVGSAVIANTFDLSPLDKSKNMINFGGKEGGVVLDEDQNVIGILLPSISFSDSPSSIYFSFAISAKTILELANSTLDKLSSTHTLQSSNNQTIFQNNHTHLKNICLLQTNYGHFTGIIINENGYILSVRHGLDQYSQINNTKVQVHIINYNKILDATLICISKGDYDISLFKIKQDLKELNLQIKPIELQDISENIKEGTQVYSLGYGIIHPTKLPQISQGIISKIIKTQAQSISSNSAQSAQTAQNTTKEIQPNNNNNVLIQSNTSIQNGCSGGALFSKDRNKLLGMIMFNLKHIKYGNICDMNFSLHYSVLQPLFKLLKQDQINNQDILALNIWTYQSQEIQKLQTLQTIEQVPQYNIRPLL